MEEVTGTTEGDFIRLATYHTAALVRRTEIDAVLSTDLTKRHAGQAKPPSRSSSRIGMRSSMPGRPESAKFHLRLDV